jgi:pimeloyl-ACP methyl ester carboxylesterase
LTHSYGGVPATQSLKTLSLKARQAEGKEGGVSKIIYMAAVALPVGGSVLSLLEAPDFLKIEARSFFTIPQQTLTSQQDDYMKLESECAPFLYSDFSPEEALRLARAMPQHSTASYREQLSYPGYEDVGVHYVICEEDKLIVTAYQYGMVEFLKGASKGEVGVHKIKSGHVPNLTQPDNVADIVKRIIGST